MQSASHEGDEAKVCAWFDRERERVQSGPMCDTRCTLAHCSCTDPPAVRAEVRSEPTRERACQHVFRHGEVDEEAVTEGRVHSDGVLRQPHSKRCGSSHSHCRCISCRKCYCPHHRCQAPAGDQLRLEWLRFTAQTRQPERQGVQQHHPRVC
jgi:hypothetical protein